MVREYYLIENAIKEIKSSLNDRMIDFNLDIIDGRETDFRSGYKFYRDTPIYG